MTIEYTTAKRESIWGWSRNAKVDGVEYAVSVKRGKSVRIAFKPRGQNRGFHWHGTVFRLSKGDDRGGMVWSGRVPRSIGVRGLLIEAGVYTDARHEAQATKNAEFRARLLRSLGRE